MVPIRNSRSGLTSCPSCHHHIHTTDDVHETSCPFCGASLVDAAWTSDERGVLDVIREHARTSQSALAGALVSMSIAGCSTDADTGGGAGGGGHDAGAQVDAATDAGSGADAGSAADAGNVDDVSRVEDGGPAPLYGIPPGEGE